MAGARREPGAWRPLQFFLSHSPSSPPPKTVPWNGRPVLAGSDTARPPCPPHPLPPRVLQMDDFFPETYRLDMRDEREAFFTLFDGERPLDARSALGRRAKCQTQVGAWSGQGRAVPGGQVRTEAKAAGSWGGVLAGPGRRPEPGRGGAGLVGLSGPWLREVPARARSERGGACCGRGQGVVDPAFGGGGQDGELGRSHGGGAARGAGGWWAGPGPPVAQVALSAETQMWICKPTACNQGKGIFLLRSQEEVAALQAKTQSAESDLTCRKTPFRVPQARVVQRYWPGRQTDVGGAGLAPRRAGACEGSMVPCAASRGGGVTSGRVAEERGP